MSLTSKAVEAAKAGPSRREIPDRDGLFLIVQPSGAKSWAFRYRSPHGSRFRAPGEPGVWYGAKELHTACAEVAYWRWRFLTDSAGLRDGELVTEHTLFQARARGRAIDLREPPWSAMAARWTDPLEHAPCQALGRAARRHVAWLRYASVRWPGGSFTTWRKNPSRRTASINASYSTGFVM